MKSIRLSLLLVILAFAGRMTSQEAGEQKAFELYGHIMTDIGYNFGQTHSDWFDVVRPTKLPIVENQFGTDGNVYFSVRQTRFGAKAWFPTSLGDLKTTFEFELFGTGVDAGQTTFRLRHAYAELGKFGVGQTWSPFMDIDVFPNTLEYWGPNGMVFFRNIQIRYMPIQGDSRLTIALERPGASADQGVYSEIIQNNNVKGHFPVPDLSAEYRHAGSFGYVELAGMFRYIGWEDQNGDNDDLSDNVMGWGLNLSSNLNVGKNVVLRLQGVYGEGIQNYMNDAPVDIGTEQTNDPNQSVIGVPLPILGIVAFADLKWSDKWTSSIGFSRVDITNSEGQAQDAYQSGNYGAVNLLYNPVPNAMMGMELQYGSRTNNIDKDNPAPGLLEDSDMLKLQFSFKYNFSQAFYRKASM